MMQKSSGGYQVRVNYAYGTDLPLPPPQPPQQSPQQLQARALAVVRAFEPKRVVGFDKIRIGRKADGGYVYVNDFSGVGAAVSLGIENEVSWDLDIAQRNIPVYQFDHTIDKAPVPNPLLTFHKLRVAPVDAPGEISLDSIARRYLAHCERAVLKMDIEGEEWNVFNATSRATLEKFSQIACEFHWLEHAADARASTFFLQVLTKMRSVFEVVHVHGNNSHPFVNIGNLMLPELLEVTFVNRRHYQFEETNERFPTQLDYPNIPQIPDMLLGCFKF